MKFPSLALALLAAAPSAFACVHSTGSITHDPFNINSGIGAELWDNGSVVCGDSVGNWHFDQDGHYSAACRPGFVFAVTKNGEKAWYRNGDHAYSWLQHIKTDRLDCYGACEDRKGACVKCTQYSWDVKQFC